MTHHDSAITGKPTDRHTNMQNFMLLKVQPHGFSGINIAGHSKARTGTIAVKKKKSKAPRSLHRGCNSSRRWLPWYLH
jgi:hypothetical protein